jgi:Flp pilus assembly protein TadG
MRRRAEPGQSSVEAALLLPLVAVSLALVLHMGVAIRDHLALWRAAGTAARLASIDPDDTASIQAFVNDSLHLAPTTVTIERVDDLVTTTLRHRYALRLLFINTHLRLFDMTARVTMHVEDTG